MTVQLRPHHLLCILTHVGKGYSPAFTTNMAVIIQRITAREDIEIVDGPDDICAPLLGESDAHCYQGSVVARDRAASDDIGKFLAVSIKPGMRLVLDEELIRVLRGAFAATRVRSACDGCDWNSLCSSVAASGYARTSL